MERDDDGRLRGGIKGDLGRADRLAAELRENLKRRKSRSRVRNSEEDPKPSGGAKVAD